MTEFSQLTPRMPPRGWNSYNGHGCAITEAEFRANAEVLAARLLSSGYAYACVDGLWYYDQVAATGLAGISPGDPCLDDFGRPTPSIARFPSAAHGAGFKPLADFVHGLGLKFGLHLMRGIPRAAARRKLPIAGTPRYASEIADPTRPCVWENTMYGVDMRKEGAQAWYDSLLALYAEWGVDFLKADDFLNPYAREEIEGLHRAAQRCGRPIALSLSPGIHTRDILSTHAHVAARSDMWRISADVWDRWSDVRQLFPLCAAWSGRIGPDSFPDADMLPYGALGLGVPHARPMRRSRLTEDEVRTHFTLLCMARSPLFLGGDLQQLDQFTEGILTNPEVLAINSASRDNRQLWIWPRSDLHVAWGARETTGNAQFLALFNLEDAPAVVKVDLAEQGFGERARVRDLWRRADLGILENEIAPLLAPHACALYRLQS